MGDFFVQAETTPTSRIVDRVAAGVCLLGALLLPFVHGVATLGQLSFYVAAQSGVLHAVRVAGYDVLPAVRYATAGLALGACFSLHGVLRLVHSERYLEYAGGPPLATAVDGVVVVLDHVVMPLATAVHIRRAPVTNPLTPVLVVVAELAVVALVHDLVPSDGLRDLNGPQQLQLLVAHAASASAWVLLLDTLNRYFLRTP